MGQDIAFTDCQIPVEDIEEFALHATDVAQIKYARPSSPTNVLDSIIIEVLPSKHQSTHDHPFACPLLNPDLQV